MRTVYETIGFSGSGKSTFARNYIKDKPNVKIVSPDGFRKMFNGEYRYEVEMDNVITQCTFFCATRLLERGYDVIIDCGNLTTSMDRRGLWKILPADKFIAIVMPMDKPVEWYVERRMRKPHWDKNWRYIVEKEMEAFEPPITKEFDKVWLVDENGRTIK